MARLEDLVRGTQVAGALNTEAVTVVDVRWFGSAAMELTYKDAAGRLGNQLLFRDDEPRLLIATFGRQWAFDADGGLLRLVSEAYRIHLAYLFDPLLAVHTSLVDPLPHQITAVYEEMLTRQPLRFLLADDPGAGKTIMAGLLIKELLMRGARWASDEITGQKTNEDKATFTATFPKPASGYAATFAEVSYEIDGKPFTLSTQIHILPPAAAATK